MKTVVAYFRELASQTLGGWNRFWFTPTDPATLGLIRLLAGAMLLYTHLVWTLDLEAFFGPDGWLPKSIVGPLREDQFAWSYLWLIESRWLLWAAHLAALVVFAMLCLGLFSRAVSVAAYFITVAYANRAVGSLFGLDQINALLAMYLMIGPSGAAFSVDRWLARRRAHGALAPAAPSVSANIAIRLIQVHMCIVYLFAGLSKLQGPSWWDGTAMWIALGNLEYQSLDMTWLVNWPMVIAVLTHVTVFWEVSYAALVWPRLTRPIVIVLAVPLHLGIAFCLGMVTFGLVMLFGNLAFVSPSLVRAMFDRRSTRAAMSAAAETTAPARPPRGMRARPTGASVTSSVRGQRTP